MKPMLATPGEIPLGAAWCYEVKWDGMRVLAEVDADGAVGLRSRNGSDLTDAFPELAGLAELGVAATLDGEVVVLDATGAPSFDRLAARLGITDRLKAADAARSAAATYVIFDLLALDGRSLVGLPLRRRRELLTGLVLPPGPFLVPDVFHDAAALLAATKQRGLEGVVAKRWDSVYRPGVRSRDWVKHAHRSTTDALVIAYRASGGAAVSVALATAEAQGLRYRGTAGAGLSSALGGAIARQVQQVPRPPVELGAEADRLTALGFRWVAPTLVVEVEHLGVTAAGRFRQPVVVRVRPDIAASDQPVTVSVAGRRMRVTHLDKMLYPKSGTTKAQVVQYYLAVAEHLLALAADRPVTRRRWPDGVARQGFFEKNLPDWAPDWIGRVELASAGQPVTYPVLAADDTAALVWLAAHSALELHTPQWRVAAAGRPDRLVVDLDPGPGVGLAACGEVAMLMREELARDGLAAHAVLSGSKGLHLYAPLPQPLVSADEAASYVRDAALRCADRAPGLVVVTMANHARAGRVFIDWSQNRAAKTTLAPWSLRGSAEPMSACPVSWEEVAAGELRQLRFDEVLQRLRAGNVPTPW